MINPTIPPRPCLALQARGPSRLSTEPGRFASLPAHGCLFRASHPRVAVLNTFSATALPVVRLDVDVAQLHGVHVTLSALSCPHESFFSVNNTQHLQLKALPVRVDVQNTLFWKQSTKHTVIIGFELDR